MKIANTKPIRPSRKTVLAFLICTALLNVTLCNRNAFAQTNQPIGLPPDVTTTLENADTFTLFSIDPDPDFGHLSRNTFQGHIILGQLDISSRGTRMELIDALNEGIAAVIAEEKRMGATFTLPDCFNPRHAIRAKKGDETVELIICFECGGQIYVTSHSATNQLYVTSAEAAAIFNKVLKDAGIPIADQDALYYVGGEVAHPGYEKYPGKTTVTAAIQAAGGFTPFASHMVWLRHPADARIRIDVDKALKDNTRDPPVYPGDVIDVPLDKARSVY